MYSIFDDKLKTIKGKLVVRYYKTICDAQQTKRSTAANLSNDTLDAVKYS
jgi:hypothetical protein